MIETFEKFQTTKKRIAIDEAELGKINKANGICDFSMDDVTAKRLYAVEAVLIDDKPTKNGRQYTPEWQESMKEKWAGTKLVFAAETHQPEPKDEYGWVYDAWTSSDAGSTATYARMAIPVLLSTAPLVERIRSGLNQTFSIGAFSSEAVCGECGADILKSGRCTAHRQAVAKYVKGAAPIHVAFTADPGSDAARIVATSESREPEPAPSALTTEERVLLEDAKRIRQPVITEAIRFARLIDPNRSIEDLTARFEKWSIAEIEMYRDSQRATYESRNPNASQQLSVASTEEAPPPEWKPLDQIVKRNRK